MMVFLLHKQAVVAWSDDDCYTIFEDDFESVVSDNDSSPKCHYDTDMGRSDFETDVVIVIRECRHLVEFLNLLCLFVIMLMKHILRSN